MLKVLDSAVPIACWSCAVAHNESTLFCPHCSKIQPPPGADYFSVFSLEPRLTLDLGMLEHQFHKLSRKLHPDRFARATPDEKEWSLADTALLNDAYRTLRDPIRRTEYLLKLRGAEIGEEHSGKGRTDPCLLYTSEIPSVKQRNLSLRVHERALFGNTLPRRGRSLKRSRRSGSIGRGRKWKAYSSSNTSSFVRSAASSITIS